ncbi:MAG: hypothetical protein KDD60_03800, partial [Bdellovibrionales bacterium]|nr:hypothetical protein [Bdellovibrionales bacterium]
MTDSKHLDIVQTDKPISAYVRVESLLLSTASADAYRAFDLGQKQSCCLWIGRALLPSGSREILDFLKRFEAIDSIDPPICVIGGYGVDAEGRPFALYPPLDGYKVTAGNLEGAEAERRFTTCLRLVSILHERGISCGDLSSDSFWVTRDGDLLFIGLLGVPSADPAEALQTAPAGTMPFVAPELFQGEPVSVRSDVFSLGVLGYYLLSQQYPFGTENLQYTGSETATPIDQYIGNPPVWANDLLRKSLSLDPNERFTTATEMLDELKKIRARTSADESMPVTRRKSSAAVRLTEQAMPSVRQQPENLVPAVREKPAQGVQTSHWILLLLLLLVGGGAVMLMFPIFSTDVEQQALKDFEEQFQAEATLDQTVTEFADSNRAFSEKEALLKELSASDDPVTHRALMKSAMEAPNERFRALSERYILERATRLGLARTAEQVRQWLKVLPRGHYPASYESLLELLDRALPAEERFAALRRAYSTNPVVALRVAAALAFDLEALDDFQQVLSQLVGDN